MRSIKVEITVTKNPFAASWSPKVEVGMDGFDPSEVEKILDKVQDVASHLVLLVAPTPPVSIMGQKALAKDG